MSQQNKLLLTLIEALDENGLYVLAKTYLKEVDGIQNIFISNGPWDSGLDLVPNTEIEIQYQATIEEKGFEKKLNNDLIKANKNVSEYGLPNKVKYFYSHPISNTTVLKAKKAAKDNYNIFLDLLDANKLADISNEYPELGRLLFNLANLEKFQAKTDFFDNVRVKAFYDLMSFGKSTDIKYSIIKSFVLNYLFNNSPFNKKDLLIKTNEHFNSNINDAYFDYFIGRLISEKRLGKDSNNLILSDEERRRIDLLLQNYQIEEGLLIRDISEALSKYGIKESFDTVLAQLSELYESNYSLNLGEFTYRETNINDIKTATNNLRQLICKLSENSGSETDVDDLIKLLIKIADSSEILPRIAAGHVYSKVSDPDRLQEYIRQNINNTTIFLDANVVLYALLVHYEDNSGYDNYFYKVASQFLKFAKANNLKLKTSMRYSLEITFIFEDALSIIPFTRLPVFNVLGGSNNPFYKYFLYLSDYDLLRNGVETFEDFLKEFKFNFRTRLRETYKSQMDFLLNSMEIEIEDFESYELVKTMDMIAQDLKEHHKMKSKFAISSDAIMFERLADSDSAVNPLDPIFCTWDSSLVRVRRRYFEDFPNCTKWFMFTPTRLMDHFSMMNFQIKPGMVSNEVLSILDRDSISQMTHTLLDSIAIIINPEDTVGLKYTNMLATMRDRDIVEVDLKPEVVPDHNSDTTPIDAIFRQLFETYILNKDSKDKFKDLFTKEEYFEEVSSLLIQENKNVNVTGIVSNELLEKFNKILEKSY